MGELGLWRHEWVLGRRDSAGGIGEGRGYIGGDLLDIT